MAATGPAVSDDNRVFGFWTAVSLVIGNMIGSGIFLLPASLAAFGGLSLAGWLVSATGSLLPRARVRAARARAILPPAARTRTRAAPSATSPDFSSRGATGFRSGARTPRWPSPSCPHLDPFLPADRPIAAGRGGARHWHALVTHRREPLRRPICRARAVGDDGVEDSAAGVRRPRRPRVLCARALRRSPRPRPRVGAVSCRS